MSKRRAVEARLKRQRGQSEAARERVSEATSGLEHFAWCRICGEKVVGTRASLKAHVHKQNEGATDARPASPAE